MDVHWIIEDELNSENKDSFTNYCKNFTKVKYSDFMIGTDGKVKGFTNVLGTECNICYGSIQSVKKLQKTYPLWHPGSYAYFPNYDCAKYYPYFLDYLLNRNSYILPLGTIMKDFVRIFDWFEEDYLFMRPISGSKTFTGKVFALKDVFEKLKMEKDFHLIGGDELVLVAPSKNLGKEWRIVVAENKVIGGSLYKRDGEIKEERGLPDHVKEYSEEILKNVKYRPDLAFVMDVCEEYSDIRIYDDLRLSDLKLIELNSFSCSGMYACDLEPIVEAVESLAYWDWDDFYGGKN